jgi:hypothetical protein
VSTELSVRVPTTLLPDANNLKVSVFYSKGGLNYFNYKDEARGYWASVNPITVSVDGPFLTETYSAVLSNPRSFKVFLAPATRFNRKTLTKLADKVLPIAATLVDPLAAGLNAVVASALTDAAAGVA